MPLSDGKDVSKIETGINPMQVMEWSGVKKNNKSSPKRDLERKKFPGSSISSTFPFKHEEGREQES